jgi:hypothetical protein
MKKIVTFGEIMLRLSPPGFQRFSQARSFDVIFGGGEANVGFVGKLGMPSISSPEFLIMTSAKPASPSCDNMAWVWIIYCAVASVWGFTSLKWAACSAVAR